jgi:hypothetical protein
MCLSSIILSPLNGNVKMSPYETGDIHVGPEGTATGLMFTLTHSWRYSMRDHGDPKSSYRQCQF